jgi:ribonucleoside-triphosphate reductase (thioredoxin)
VVERVIRAADTQLGVAFTKDEEDKLRDHMLQLRCSVAGRFLWQLGTSTVDRLGLASLQNCAAVCVNEPIRPFTWAMDFLMLGCGVGFNIQREFVYELPKVLNKFSKPVRMDNSSAEFIVPDTREGWVKLLEYTLRAAFNPGDKNTFTYSTQLIRGAGAPIKGFGGTASGAEVLCWGINEIAELIEKRRGKKLRTIDCLDIMCIIGAIVVAGNVRRSALIALGDQDDFQYLRAKRWDLGNIPNYRANANLSVVVNDFSTLPDEIWKGYKGTGEPYGLINLKLSRACGRLGETKYKDKDVIGYNP